MNRYTRMNRHGRARGAAPMTFAELRAAIAPSTVVRAGLRTFVKVDQASRAWRDLFDDLRKLGGDVETVQDDFFDVLVPEQHEDAARARLNRFVAEVVA